MNGPTYDWIGRHVHEENESLEFVCGALDILRWAEQQDALVRELVMALENALTLGNEMASCSIHAWDAQHPSADAMKRAHNWQVCAPIWQHSIARARGEA